jgi:hypothetical protein
MVEMVITLARGARLGRSVYSLDLWKKLVQDHSAASDQRPATKPGADGY